MIRLALENTSGLAALEFDLGERELRVFHDSPVEPIASKLESLGLRRPSHCVQLNRMARTLSMGKATASRPPSKSLALSNGCLPSTPPCLSSK